MSARHIKNMKTAHACSAAGISVLQGRLVTYQNLLNAVNNSIVETSRAQSQADLLKTGLLVVQLVKALCDATIDVLGTLYPAGESVKAGYSAVSPLADQSGKWIAGARVTGTDWARSGIGALQGASSRFVPGGVYGDLSSLQTIKASIIVDAMNSDFPQLRKDLASYAGTIGSMAARVAGHTTIRKWLEVTTAISKLGLDITAAVSEFQENHDANNLASSISTLRKTQTQLVSKIRELQHAIAMCAAQTSPPRKHRP